MTTPPESTDTDFDRVAFSVAIPPSWTELDLRPMSRDRSISFMVSESVAQAPQLRARQAEITAFVRDAARQAWDIGSRFCAVFVESAEDGIVPGSLTVTLLPPPPTAPGGSVLDTLIEQVGTDEDSGSMSMMIADLPHAGRAVRTYGVQLVEAVRNRPRVPTVLMHTFLPFPGGIALISCTSPATDLEGPLLELFDVVTESFRIHDLTDGA